MGDAQGCVVVYLWVYLVVISGYGYCGHSGFWRWVLLVYLVVAVMVVSGDGEGACVGSGDVGSVGVVVGWVLLVCLVATIVWFLATAVVVEI